MIILEFINAIIRRGANFCQVSNKKRVNQAIFFVILGNQKCRGAPPNLSVKEKITRIEIRVFENIEYQDNVK